MNAGSDCSPLTVAVSFFVDSSSSSWTAGALSSCETTTSNGPSFEIDLDDLEDETELRRALSDFEKSRLENLLVGRVGSSTK